MQLVAIPLAVMGLNTWYIIATGRYPQLAELPFWVFVLVGGLVFCGLMLFRYMIVAPSSIAFGNLQGCTHENPIYQKLLEHDKELKEIKKLLKRGKLK